MLRLTLKAGQATPQIKCGVSWKNNAVIIVRFYNECITNVKYYKENLLMQNVLTTF